MPQYLFAPDAGRSAGTDEAGDLPQRIANHSLVRQQQRKAGMCALSHFGLGHHDGYGIVVYRRTPPVTGITSPVM